MAELWYWWRTVHLVEVIRGSKP